MMSTGVILRGTVSLSRAQSLRVSGLRGPCKHQGHESPGTDLPQGSLSLSGEEELFVDSDNGPQRRTQTWRLGSHTLPPSFPLPLALSSQLL